MIFIVTFLLLIYLTYRYDYCKAQTFKTFWMFTTLLLLIVIVGMRYRIGVDSIRYESFYEKLPTIRDLTKGFIDHQRFEAGFVIFMSICKSISKDFIFFQFIHAIIINTAVFTFFRENTKNFFFAITSYFLMIYIPLNIEVLREALAVATFLFSWHFFKKNQFIIYYLFIFLAMSFHLGATVLLLIPIFALPVFRPFFSIGKRTWIICLLIPILGFAINLMFFDFVKLISFSVEMTDRASTYAKDDLGGSTYNVMGVIGLCVRYVAYPLFALYCLKELHPENTKEEKRIRSYDNICAFISIFISLMTIPISIFHRFNSYFIFFSILVVSQWVFTRIPLKKKKLKLSFTYWFALFLPLLVFQINSQLQGENKSGSLKGYMRYIPYYTRIDQQTDHKREALFRYHKAW